MGTDFLYKFSKEHPQILDKYKSELRRTANKKTAPVLVTKRKVLTGNERIDIIANIKAGTVDATNYHKIIYDSLIHIFGKRLSNPKAEVKINEGRKRIDIVFTNANNHGFFHDLNSLHHIKCPKIFVECKNYGHEIGNPEIDQLQGRFANQRGNFGILVCRSIKNKKEILLRCRDVLHDRHGYIIVLEDSDINSLINFKETEQEDKIDEYMAGKLDEIIM